MSRQQRIEEHLRSGFAPVYLEVLNESHNHSAGSENSLQAGGGE
jgi:stress-induced morphogen